MSRKPSTRRIIETAPVAQDARPALAELEQQPQSRVRQSAVRHARRSALFVRLWRPVAVLLVVLGPVLAVVTYRSARAYRAMRVETRFEDALQRCMYDLTTELSALVEVVHSCRSLYDSSQEVTRAEFATFTQEARRRHPSILAIAWAPMITASARSAHVASARAEGFSEYEIVDGGAEGPRRRAAPAPRHYPVYFVEPLAENLAVLGTDLLSEPVRRAAVEAALGSADAVLSDPVPLPDRRWGGLLVLAVRAPATARSTAEPPTCLGLLLLVLAYDRIFDPGSPEARGLRLELRDASAGRQRVLLAARSTGSGGSAASVTAAGVLSKEAALHVAGQDWLLTATAPQQSFADPAGPSPLWTALAVLVIAELVAAFVLVLAHTSRAHALNRQAHMIRRVLRSLTESVVVADVEGRVVLANDAALRLLEPIDPRETTEWPREAGFLRVDGHTPFTHREFPLERATRGQPVPEETMVLRNAAHPDGVRLLVSAVPILNDAGQPLGSVMVLRDVTDRHRLEEREIEMRVATQVQRRLYPRAAPEASGLQIAAAVVPAEATCGDYCDFVTTADGSISLVVGDVSGHGLGPALVMAQTRAYLRALASQRLGGDEILNRLNEHLVRDLGDGLFVTLLILCVHPGSRRFCYASAGHTPAFLLGADGSLRGTLTATGPALGLFAGKHWTERSGPAMAVGEVLVLATDGAIECPSPDGRLFEEVGLLGAVRETLDGSAEEILAHLKTALRQFGGGAAPRDDITLIVCKAVPEVELIAAAEAHG